MKRKKKYPAENLERKKISCPPEKKKLADQKSSPPPQELNGRPLMFLPSPRRRRREIRGFCRRGDKVSKYAVISRLLI